jgi:hypothetical protein
LPFLGIGLRRKKQRARTGKNKSTTHGHSP